MSQLMLLWKTQVMNFITWALNSDSTAALFKSSQQGTVWKFTYPVRNTGSYKIQTKIRCVRGKRMSKVYLCVWVSHVGMHSTLLGQLRDTRPSLSMSAPICLPMTASMSSPCMLLQAFPHPEKLQGTLAGFASPYPPMLPQCLMEEGVEHQRLPLLCPDSLLPLSYVSHCLFSPLLEAKGMEWML